jgi:uncharacterized protein (TIGR02246 family)
MNFSGPLEDRIAIRELLETFADATAREDVELLATCWVDDSVWVTPQGREEGKESIVASWEKYTEAYRRGTGVIYRATFYQPAAIRIDGDTATGTTYFSVVTFTDQGVAPNVFAGAYAEEYAKVDGRWRFRSRQYQPIDKLRVKKEHETTSGPWM